MLGLFIGLFICFLFNIGSCLVNYWLILVVPLLALSGGTHRRYPLTLPIVGTRCRHLDVGTKMLASRTPGTLAVMR